MNPVWLALPLCVISCISRNGASPTYKPFSALRDSVKDARLHEIKMGFESIERPKLKIGLELDSNWLFRIGSERETLHADFIENNGDPINLPHRVLLPNTALWYECIFGFVEPGYLIVGADDGSQVFLDGERVKRLHSNLFPIEREGTHLISIRVLNNAMAGGLRNVSFCSIKEFDHYQGRLKKYERIRTAVEKVLLKKVAETEEIAVVERMLSFGGSEEHEPDLKVLNIFPLLAGPYISGGDNGEMQILVRTERDEMVQFKWGKSPTEMTNRLSAVGPVASFGVPSLLGTEEFYYQISSGQTTTGAIRVPTTASESFTFNVWADSQGGWETFSSITKSFDKQAAFSVGVGDLVANGSEAAQWETLARIMSDFSSTQPFYLIPGNHDYDGYYDDLSSKNYVSFSGNSKSYFSWHHSNAAFIALDPNQTFPIGFDQSQKQWFYDELESASWQQAKWKFVFLHQPPYSQGWPGYHGDEIVRELLEPVFESAKIDFIVSGHTHDYERLTKVFGKQKVNFLILGGAGGSLEPDENSNYPEMDVVIKQHHFGHFEVEGRKVGFKVISPAGELIDHFDFVKDE
ncbi:MAG: metallophosphoesterase [Cytophagales bacterium]